MVTTPDRFPGAREEEEVKLDPASLDPPSVGGVRLVSGDFRMRDNFGVFNPREGGTGVTEATHKTLRQLIHFIDSGPAEGFVSGAFQEILPAADPFPTSYIWWTSAAKTAKIVELTLTRNVTKTPNVETWKIYDTDGTTVLATVADTWTYSGVIPLSRTRAIT